MKSKIRFNLGASLMLMVICISMLSTGLMGIFFYGRVSNSVEKNYRTTVTENLSTRAGLFDGIMKDAYLTCVYGATDEQLQKLVRKDETYEALLSKLREYCKGNDSIQSIYCYINEADIFLKVSNEDFQVQYGNYLNHAWAANILEEEKTSPFTPVYNRDSTSVIQRSFFSFGKRILNKNQKEIGALFVNVDERQIFFSCLQSSDHSLDNLSIVQGDRIVSADSVSKIGQKIEETEDTILVKYATANADYSLCSVSEASVLEKDLITSRNWIFLVALILNVLLAFPVYMLLKIQLYPMKKLEESMNLVKDGNLSVRATVYREDEIGSLSDNFNDMLEQVENLIDELVTQKMLKKEAELEALSYQITPHFMYNTLSSIRYAAILDGYEEIGGLLQAFIELLRLSASDRGAFITVEQELKMVNNYIRLQQFRYKDTFETELIMEPGTEQFYVPRLLIQPLVENAILHGLDHMEHGNLIRVSVGRKGRRLEIRVADNGSGMTQDEIQTLVNGGYHSKFSGIGINNIIERLQLYYGKQGKLDYLSPEEGGTVAVITIPVSDDAEEYVI